MCTVILRVPDRHGDAIRLLAVRDEDPARPWNPLGPWWQDLPGVTGVQDRRAGGAWLATHSGSGRLAVLLNRPGEPRLPAANILSRGSLPLEAVAGRDLPRVPHTRGFNLVSVADGAATLTTWDGETLSRTPIAPGTHMIAHDDLDDPRTARITAWLAEFRDAALGDGPDWFLPWTEVLARTTTTRPTDDRAIIRDNRPFGIPTLSTLACVADIRADRVDTRYAELRVPGAWDPLDFT
ncbi:NRDE family protein [Microbacterium amylolyticum]|uniref:Transport and Golgi organisation 2 n=1 Tax=Microbacterium amylolyticum TaxID=936337 RepID=A0ABS4ZGB9_9MICO|nr:NRDE family protein [Microbacterium amylolyticum]MBP2436331.1 hypothetical protein [Microbacterium amylolyticum]